MMNNKMISIKSKTNSKKPSPTNRSLIQNINIEEIYPKEFLLNQNWYTKLFKTRVSN